MFHIQKLYQAFATNLFGAANVYAKGSYMRRSKMELCISTLQALAYYGPLKITRITYKANMNCGQIQDILDGLIQNSLVEKRTLRKNNVVYAATPKARTILSYFEQIKVMLPIAEDEKPTF